MCLARAHAIAAERTPWSLIGVGLVLYAGGSVVYNLDLSSGAEIGFPSRADTLWLSLYPLCFAGMVSLVRARHVQVNASLWLDALIGGSAVAAVAAVFLLPPIFEPVVGEGWETAARLAYPLADLLLTGFAVVLWGAGRWRFDAWFGLAARVRADRRQRQRLRARPDGGRLDSRLARRPRLRRRVDAARRRGRGARSRAGAACRTRAWCCRSRSP